MANDIQDLLDLMAEFKVEVNNKVEKLVTETKANSGIHKQIDDLKKAIELQRQLVKEYKEHKDPIGHQFAIAALQKQGSDLVNKTMDLTQRLKKFEVENWLKLFTDEELIAQYELAGKPTHTVVGKALNTTPENAFNYTHALVKDPELRWKFYKFCVKYASSRKEG